MNPLRLSVARLAAATLSIVALSTVGTAQGPAFDSPGMRTRFTSGQTTRFTNDFNPAVGVVIDAIADVSDPERGNAGFDGDLRLVELNLSAFVDPDAWAYLVVNSESLEGLGIEEAAVEYLGMPGNQSVKAGQFFVDFGKQMQMHLEELRTRERPLPLREFLGEELSGLGVQYDNWFALSDTTPLRFSFGAFASLLGEEHGHEDEEEEAEPAGAVPDRKDLDELSFSGRVTTMTEVGSAVVQVGASARYVPEFNFEEESANLLVDGLSNLVYGADLTVASTDDTGLKTRTFGAEYLVFDGDLAGMFDDPDMPTAIQVVDDTAAGFFVFGDFSFDQQDSAGFQYAMADLVEDPSKDASELDLYFTRHLTELRRLRFGVTLGEVDGLDENTFYVQFTNFFGNHAHGLNW